MIRIACSDSEASCLIASLITEIAMPCPCEGGPLRICGTGPDGARQAGLYRLTNLTLFRAYLNN